MRLLNARGVTGATAGAPEDVPVAIDALASNRLPLVRPVTLPAVGGCMSLEPGVERALLLQVGVTAVGRAGFERLFGCRLLVRIVTGPAHTVVPAIVFRFESLELVPHLVAAKTTFLASRADHEFPGGVHREVFRHNARKRVASRAVLRRLPGHRAQDDFRILGGMTVGLPTGFIDWGKSVHFLSVTGHACHALERG